MADGEVGSAGSQREGEPGGYQAEVSDGSDDVGDVCLRRAGDGHPDEHASDDEKDALPDQVDGEALADRR